MSEDRERLLLLAKAKAKASREREEPEEEEQEQIEAQPSPEGREPLESIIERDPRAGAAYGAIESVPFAKDALSAAKAVYTTATEEGRTFGEEYEANMDQWNKEINLAEEKHPGMFIAGDVVTGIATMGVGKTLKGIKALGAATMFGGASGLSRSENRSPSDFLFGAGLGAGGDLLGKGAGALSKSAPMQKLGRRLGILADHTTVDIIDPSKNKKYLNKTLNSIYKKFNKSTGKVEVPSPDEVASMFSKDLDNISVRGKSLIDPDDSMNAIVVKFRNLADDVDDSIGAMLTKGDVELDEKTIKSIYERHKQSLGLDDMRSSGSKDAIEQADALERKLYKDYFDEAKEFTYVTEEVPLMGANGQPVIKANGDVIMQKVSKKVPTKADPVKKLSLLDLHKRKRFYSQSTNMDNPLASLNQTDQAFYKKGSGILSDVIPDLLDDSDAFRELNKVSRIARIGKELTQKTSDAMEQGGMSRVKSWFQMRAVMMMGAGAAGGGPIGATAGFAVAQLANASKDPKINSKAAMYLKKVSQAIQNGTDGSYIKRLSIASSLSDADFGKAVASIASEVTLMESPIKRTYADIEDKSDFILEAVSFHSPDKANQLRDAFDNNDEEGIRTIMDQVSKDPSMQLMFEDGKGIDGRVFSEEDKQQLKSEVDNMDVSYIQKLKHHKALDNQGLIPQVVEEPERFFQYQRRDKTKPNY
jgi:hypothetical protein